MIPDDSRNQFRRVNQRRNDERRLLQFDFMSPEWLNRIREEYLMWPKSERRAIDRRNLLRRIQKRRIKKTSIRKTPRHTNQHDLLTQEEKQFLNELVRQDKKE